jgi:hypothetical protein
MDSQVRTASACGFTPLSIIWTQVASVSLSSLVFRSCEISYKAAGPQLDPPRCLHRLHPLSKVSRAEMICSDSRADDMVDRDGALASVSVSAPTMPLPKKWPSPLQDYQGPRDPLPVEIEPDGRLRNTPAHRSPAWDQAPNPFHPGRPNFDFHGRHHPGSPSDPAYPSAHSLLQPKRRERNSVRTGAP